MASAYELRVRSCGTTFARVGVQLAGALETSHTHGVVHGDVKPDNVLIGRVGQALLGDFGVAVLLSRSQVTQQALLTPLHAAPELFVGAPASVATDVYGLGSTLVSLLTGNSPVGGPSDLPEVIVSRAERGERLPISRTEAPSDLVELLGALTAQDAAERPQSAARVGEALAEIQRGNGESPSEMMVMTELTPLGDLSDSGGTRVNGPESTAPPAGGGPISVEPESSRGLKAILAAGAIVMTFLAAGLFLWAQSRSNSQSASGDAAAAVHDGGSGTVDDGVDPGGEGSAGESDPTDSTAPQVPRSDLAGIQPGIVYGAGDQSDTSTLLAAKLSEESVVFQDLPGAVVPFPYYGVRLQSLPATFHYQSFNPTVPGTCDGMMSRPLTVVGLWERGTTWPQGFSIAAVAQTDGTSIAHELATVISVGLGVDAADCHGFGSYNVADYDDYGVEHRDVDELVSGGAPYNVWSEHGAVAGGKTWAYSTRMVMEVGPYVVDLALATDSPLAAGNDHVVGQVASQIRSRLMSSQ